MFDSSEPCMTSRQGFETFLAFLEAYWIRRGKSSNDIAALLGSSQLGKDGFPLDRALWEDWLEAWNGVRTKV
jgi:hypothetical protein